MRKGNNMRKEIVERTLYKFDELSDTAKDKARDWYLDWGPDYEWWDSVYEDANMVGLIIKEFNIDRGSYVKAVFISSAEETAHKIEKEHGEKCETRIDAENYLKERNTLIETAPKNEDGDYADEMELDEKLDVLDDEFLKTLQEDYRIMLQKGYEYLTNNESVDETLRANEYEFLENGKRG
jgi:hypothetical protein